MVKFKAQEKNIAVNLNVDSTLYTEYIGDDVRLRQVLINLMNNAVKYTEKGSVTLSITGSRVGNSMLLHFSVEDTGIGIKEDEVTQLFAKYERIAEHRNRHIEGTGLGLSITMNLLKLMNSKLKVKSEYKKGSVFSFDLMQEIASEDTIGNIDEKISTKEIEYSYSALFVAPDKNILVVDDNYVNRKVFKELLKETKVKIDEANSGKECLTMVRNKKYDMIFLDHMMLEMDGIETLKAMRDDEYNVNTDTPVIAITANVVSGAREMYISEGFDDFISKPIKPERLEKLIQKTLGIELCELPEEINLSDLDEMEFPDLEGIEWQYGILHLRSRKSVMDTLKKYYGTMENDADKLNRLQEELDPDNPESFRQYRVHVHSMKTNSQMVGAWMLAGMAKMLELSAKDEKYEFIKSSTPEFIREWIALKDRIDEKSNELFGTDGEDKAPADYLLIQDYLTMLNNAVQEMEIDEADQIMEQLQKYEYSEEIQSLVKKLSAAVTGIDMDRVASIVEEIKAQIEEITEE